MAEVIDAKPCSNPGCDHPGTSCCSACKTTLYCGPICQTADWTHHKEECDGHLRKVGMANLAKACGFQQHQNWTQTLRYGEIAATKLKQLKDRRLETVKVISNALSCKFNAFQRLGRHTEALECAKEQYTLWAMNHLRHPGSMRAALLLIQSCIHNKEYEVAENYARHAYFMIAEMTDNFIPSDQYPQFLADASHWLAIAIYHWASNGGIPPEEKQKAGEETIEHARKALELYTRLHGTEHVNVAMAMGTIADILNHFNDVDDDEVLRLREQSIEIYRRLEGSSSYNVATHEEKLGIAYAKRANRAIAANDLDRCIFNAELALPNYREAARIFRAINLLRNADSALRRVVQVEENIRQINAARVAAVAMKDKG